MESGWLLRDGEVLASIEDRAPRVQGAVLIKLPTVVHTFWCSHPLVLAWCRDISDEQGGRVLSVRAINIVPPSRIIRPILLRGVVVAGDRGSSERWGLRPGDRLEVRQPT